MSRFRERVLPSLAILVALVRGPAALAETVPARDSIPLPSSKSLVLPVPGDPRLAGGFPVTIALHPSGRYAALLDAGFGMHDSEQRQGIVVVDLETNRATHFADPRLGHGSQQTYFVGLAFSAHGDHVYASMASISDPLGRGAGNTGNGIAVYAFADGVLRPERFIPIPLSMVPPGKRAASVSGAAPLGYAVPYPAGLAVVDEGASERLLVADDLSDDAVLVDTATGAVQRRFDLGTSNGIPSSFPYAVVVSRGKKRAWVTLWNASEVAELDLAAGTVTRRIALSKPATTTAPGSHPTAMALSSDERLLYVALANADRVAVVDTQTNAVKGFLSTLLPNQRFGGSFPIALALGPKDKRLFVADSSANAVAVFDLSRPPAAGPDAAPPLGFIPTEWYPTALAVRRGELLVVAGKGRGTTPNGYKNGVPDPYIASLIQGSIARLDLDTTEKRLKALTAEAVRSNRIDVPVAPVFSNRPNPIRHVIYVIKENRTYDQILGDLGVGDGDPKLTMYGRDVTPNEHELAERFGVLDRFYDSGEVSGNGHVWSTAAITSDYTEKTWPVYYRSREHTFDFEGEVAGEVPLLQDIPDVDEPRTGYLWANASRQHVSYRDYGEFVATFWCDGKKLPPYLSKYAELYAARCARPTIHPGDELPARPGEPPRGKSAWPWQVPLPVLSVPTKLEIRGHYDPYFPAFQIDYPDQLRADEFLAEFKSFVRGRVGDRDPMPQLIIMRLPNDHTGGTRPGMARPAASVADNDLALGRVVEAVSHTAYWDDTAIMVLEDDAQNGADHVDAHRSIAFVISKYAPHGRAPFVDHAVYTTVSMLHTIEALLGLPPMNTNDAFAPVMAPLFSGAGDQPPFRADYRNRDNGLIYGTNPDAAPGAAESKGMDFSRPDAADAAKLNRILWDDAKGRRVAAPTSDRARK